MTTDETTGHDRPTRPTNGRVVPTAVADRIRPGRLDVSDPVASPEATASRRPDRDDPTDTTRPDDPTEKATRPKRRDRKKRPDQGEATRPRKRLGRLLRLPRRRQRDDHDRLVRGLVVRAGGSVTAPGGRRAALVALILTTALSAGAAFIFSFGNVGNTASLVGLPWAQQKLVSPTVDVIVIGLTFVLHFLVLAQANPRAVRAVRGILVGASVAMLVVNAVPAVLGALTTTYTGPILTATRHFTPTPDHLTAGQLWGRAGIDGLVPAFLVLWSHFFPTIVGAFAEIASRRDLEAVAQAEARTLATEADRAAAAGDRSAAAAALEAARAEATALVERAQAEATDLVERAHAEARTLVASSREEADRVRSQASVASRSASETTAEADQRARQLVREAQARADDLVAAAERKARADVETAQAERDRARADARRVRASLDADAGEHADAVRRLEQRAAEVEQRAALVDAQAAKAAQDLAAAEQLAAELDTPAGPAERPARERPAPTSTPRPNKAPAASGKARRPRTETVPAGVEAWKTRHGDAWWKVDPKKAEVMAVAGVHGELALEIRREIVREGKGAAANEGETYAFASKNGDQE